LSDAGVSREANERCRDQSNQYQAEQDDRPIRHDLETECFPVTSEIQ
jgi:hypothetical protein